MHGIMVRLEMSRPEERGYWSIRKSPGILAVDGNTDEGSGSFFAHSKYSYMEKGIVPADRYEDRGLLFI